MKITRQFTSPTRPVAEQIDWKKLSVKIEEKGKTVLYLEAVEVPKHWSQTATDILAHKYLRKAGVPSITVATITSDVMPDFLYPSEPHEDATFGGETSARQVFHRLAGHWTYEALKQGHITDEESAQAFYDELFWMLAHQMAAPNSPQWFNTGIWWAYGIEGGASGAYRSPSIGEEAQELPSSYVHPQTSACFILGLKDALLGDGSILDTVTREARIFKYGSGSGVNYSSLRAKGASLKNGGTSSGLMSFLKLFDVNAGTIKSGGTTRRAARMVIVDADHPEAEEFVTWKAREEVKVAAMVAGANASKAANDIAASALQGLGAAEYEGEAYQTVSGQNANNSLRVTDDFMQGIANNETGKKERSRNFAFWGKTLQAAWMCGDPGLQFHDTINSWHTIPKVGPQRATNPCSEYSFIDNSSCNLASLNLVKFLSQNKRSTDGAVSVCAPYFDPVTFGHACRLWTIVLDVSVGMSSYPDKLVAQNSVDYRAIGLGYANLGGLLMLMGVPYDSSEGRAYAGLVTACMHGEAWHTSQEMAADLGSFRDYKVHDGDVDRVRQRHSEAAVTLASGSVGRAAERDAKHPMHDIVERVQVLWREGGIIDVTGFGERVRNAQLTLLAPTGTIGLVMDCATTGVEPDFSLVKYKKLAGGGSLTMANPLVREALMGMGYSEAEMSDIEEYVRTSGRVDMACPHIRREHMHVFDCAGDISVEGHIGMMAAVQPFLSGAISKTVNMPSTATVEDVGAAYLLAWKSGLKAVAIYRDGCKLSQPLTAVRADTAANQPLGAQDAAFVGPLSSPSGASLVGVKKNSPRYKLPSRRRGFTQKVRVGGQSLYIRTGEYSDGKLGEVFLNLGRDGSTMRHLLDSLAVCISLGLQHGVPLQEYVDAFVDTRSEPNGMVQGSEKVKFCSSLMDYIVRELSAEYLSLEEAVPESVDGPPPGIEERKAVGTTVVATVEDVPSIAAAAVAVSGPKLVVDNSEANEPEDGEDAVDGSLGKWSDDLVMPKIIRAAPEKDTLTPGLRTLAAPRYNGNACPSCGSFTLRRSGSCHVCDSCGQTTGCS